MISSDSFVNRDCSLLLLCAATEGKRNMSDTGLKAEVILQIQTDLLCGLM